MSPRRWLVVAAGISVIGLAVLIVGSGRDAPAEEGDAARARRPDFAGVIIDVDAEGVTLDDGARYRFDARSVAFSSYTGQRVAPRPNLFVHLDVDGDLVIWMAVLGVVADLDPPRVTYTGSIERIGADEVVFADGTLLPLADGVTGVPGFAIATIDPTARQVIDIQQDVIDPTGSGSR